MRELGYLAASFLLGTMISVYQPMNSRMARLTESAALANLAFYFVAFLSSLAMVACFGGLRQAERLKGVPPVLWTTGIMSAVMVLGTIVLIPRLGARKLFILQVAGQIAMSVAVAHFGLFGTPRDELTARKLLGTLIMLCGAAVSVL